jgi:hypothetical protein
MKMANVHNVDFVVCANWLYFGFFAIEGDTLNVSQMGDNKDYGGMFLGIIMLIFVILRFWPLSHHSSSWMDRVIKLDVELLLPNAPFPLAPLPPFSNS